MSLSGIDPTTVAGQFQQLTGTLAVFLVSEDDPIGPDNTPDLVPPGWVWRGEVNEFEFSDGDWRDVYILERDE